MAYTRQIINVGITADDGSGDYLRDALIKTNTNFESLWQVGAVDSNLDISGSTIAGTVTNEDIILDPSGTGKIVVKSSIEPDTTATYSLGSATKEFTNVYSDLLTTDTLALKPLTSNPSSPADGYLYYNTSTDKFVGRVNGGWLNFQTVAVGSDNKWTTFNAESGSTTTNSTTDTLTVVGGTGISTSISGDTLTINNTSNPQAVTFNVVDDGSNAGTISNGEDLKIAGGTGITTAMSGDTLTITNSSPGTVTASSTTAFTNKTGNISQWTNDAGYITSAMTSWTLVDDGSNAGTISNGEDLKIAGGTNVTTSLAGDTLTINSSGLQNLVEDTSPELGGNLDTKGNIIQTSTGKIQIGEAITGGLGARVHGMGVKFDKSVDNSGRHYSSVFANKQTLTANIDANNKKQGQAKDNTLELAGYTHGADNPTDSTKNFGDYTYTIVNNNQSSAVTINGITGIYTKGEIDPGTTGAINATNIIGVEAWASADGTGTTTNLIAVKAKTDKGGSTPVTNRYSFYADNGDDTLYNKGPVKSDNSITGTTVKLTGDRFSVATTYTPFDATGDSGDKAGDIAVDSNYIYYCTADHDGSTNIWKRTALSTW